jgi:hypothetical protein
MKTIRDTESDGSVVTQLRFGGVSVSGIANN